MAPVTKYPPDSDR